MAQNSRGMALDRSEHLWFFDTLQARYRETWRRADVKLWKRFFIAWLQCLPAPERCLIHGPFGARPQGLPRSCRGEC